MFKSGVLKFLVLGSIQLISSEEACKTEYASLMSLPRSIQLMHLDQACVEDFIDYLTHSQVYALYVRRESAKYFM